VSKGETYSHHLKVDNSLVPETLGDQYWLGEAYSPPQELLVLMTLLKVSVLVLMTGS